MQIQEQFTKSILQQTWIEQETQQCYLLLKKQKKLFWTFHKDPSKFRECNSLEFDVY